MSWIGYRLWHASPAKLVETVRYRAWKWRQKPGWFTIQAGPAAGADLFLPNAEEGAWAEVLSGRFDACFYEALKEYRDLNGAVCWDVGANIGYHSLGFSGLGAQVLAFEPNREAARLLRANLERNPSLGGRVRVSEVALADRDGQSGFRESSRLDGGCSGSHLVEAVLAGEGEIPPEFKQVTVPTVRADTLIARGEAAPDVVKIDVEGGELLVLQGARRLLAEKKPILLLEVHHIRLMAHIAELLLESGYRLRLLDEEHAAPGRCFVLAASREVARTAAI